MSANMPARLTESEVELAELQRRLARLESCWNALLPELTVRRDRYTKALINNGGELQRGRVQALEEIIALPEELRARIQRMIVDLSLQRQRLAEPETLAEENEPI